MKSLIKYSFIIVVAWFFSSCLEKRDEFWEKRVCVVKDVYLNGGRISYVVAECDDGSHWRTKELYKFKKGDKVHYFSNTRYGKDNLKLIKICRP